MNIDQYSNYGAGKVTGAAEERERILALPLWHETFETPGLKDDHVSEACVTCHNIALIKGDNK
jgi:hypothetical protein